MFRPIHFEIHAENPERAAKFYSSLFGWEIKKWESSEMEYWMVMTAPDGDATPGINGGLVRRPAKNPSIGTTANGMIGTMDVPSIDEYMKKAVELGGTVAMEKFLIAGMAWQGYCIDTEGNLFGLHEVVKK